MLMLMPPTAPPAAPLGGVPLLIPLAIGAGAAMVTWDPLLQVLGLKQAPALAPQPATLAPPPAPQTEAKMRTWRPEDIYEAQAQQALAQRKTASAIELPAPAKETALSPWLIGALALAGLGVVLLIVR